MILINKTIFQNLDNIFEYITNIDNVLKIRHSYITSYIRIFTIQRQVHLSMMQICMFSYKYMLT